jgi:hypothetical protein
MCIAILNTKKGGLISDESIYNSWENNDMGGGLLWNKSGKLNVFKTKTYAEFLSMYKSLRADNDVENIVLHFRIATSGYDGMHNIHPFLVSENLGFVHNGVINGLGDKDYSDTYYFNEMLKNLHGNFLKNITIIELIENYIGYSKLIFLNNDGRYRIINEHYGHWVGNNWYSNDSYKWVNNYVYYGNQKVSKYDSKLDASARTFVDEDDFDYDYGYGVPKKVDSGLEERLSIDGFTEFECYEELCSFYGATPYTDEAEELLSEAMQEYQIDNCIDLYDCWVNYSAYQNNQRKNGVIN